jgi:hypothetical protein
VVDWSDVGTALGALLLHWGSTSDKHLTHGHERQTLDARPIQPLHALALAQGRALVVQHLSLAYTIAY